MDKRVKTSMQTSSSKQAYSVGSEDDKILLEIFPQEVWLDILKCVMDSKDYWSICTASKCLQKIISQHRKLLLFGMVLPLITKTRSWMGKEKAMKLLKQITGFRTVCRHWRAGVNKMFAESATKDPIFQLSIQSRTVFAVDEFRITELLQENFTLNKQERITSCLHHFGNTHNSETFNPFVRRHFMISVSPASNSFQQYFASLTKLFTKYGNQVLSMSLIVDTENADSISIGDSICQILKWLPELRALYFKFDNKQLFSNDDWNNCLNMYPMPINLRLELFVDGNVPVPLFLSLAKANPQLRMINSRNMETDIAAWHNKNVKELKLEAFAVHWIDQCAFDRWIALKMIWPLKILNLTVKTTISHIHVLKCIQETFGDTLQNLRVSTPKNTDYWTHWLGFKIGSFPCLRVLNLELKTFTDYEFLLTLTPTLEELKLVCKEMEGPFLEKSDIWVKFAKLKRICFQHDYVSSRGTHRTFYCNWTRADWEAFLICRKELDDSINQR